MWIFHPKGFVSIVTCPEDNSKLLVRGRVAGDVEKMFPNAVVTVTPKRDYRFRAVMSRAAVRNRLRDLVDAIDYDNFKDACPAERHDSYLDIWTTMYWLQQRFLPRLRKKQSGHPLFWRHH
jgi:hypothetical protein